VLVLNADDVKSALRMGDCIDIVRDVFVNLPFLKPGMPLRTTLRLPGSNGIWFLMPAFAQRYRRFSVKLVSEYPRNPERFGLPKDMGIVILADYETGRALSVQRSSKLTAIRTGAASGVATDLLANTDCERMGLIGTGIQAETQLEGVLSVRKKIKKVGVYGRGREKAENFAKRMSKKFGVDCLPFEDPDSMVAGSDVVVAATNSSVPVFHGHYLQPGCHINSIGTLPERRELDEETFMKSKVFVDTYEGATKEAGDLIDAIQKKIIMPDSITEISEIFDDPKKGRRETSDITLFKSVGFALLDLAAASKTYETAKKMGIGKEIDF
jgi:ornithine cyclodeaminase/alanine dehydrogenase-like protein (mu-crystallin family)